MELRDNGRPLRVANVIEEGRMGGPQKRLSQIAAAVKKYNIETTVFLPLGNYRRFREDLKELKVDHRELQLYRLGRGGKTLLKYALHFMFDIAGLRRELRNGGFDVVHVSGGSRQFKGVIAGRLAGVPVIWHLNDTQVETPVIYLLFQILKYLASGFIVTSGRVAGYYLKGKASPGAPVFQIQAPVDTKRFAPANVKPDEQIFSYPGTRVVSVSNISPTKGIDVLIEAAHLLSKRNASISFIVIGQIFSTQKKYAARLRALVREKGLEDCFHFLGWRDSVAEAMKAADIFVCPSRSESGPMSVWEAMSMGCPVVSSDVGDVSKYIQNGKNGFVVPSGNARALADAVQRLIDEPAMRIDCGALNTEVARTHLDVEVAARKTAECYRQIRNAHKRGSLNDKK